MSTTARDGDATVRVHDAALLKALDRISDGAATSFFRRTGSRLQPILETDRREWPRGKKKHPRSADRFFLSKRIGDKELRHGIGNRASYAYYIRWSIYTADSFRSDEAAWVARGKSPEAQEGLRRGWKKMHKLTAVAPSARLAGRSPWVTLVRTPARRALRELLPDLRADLRKLAGGG